MPSKTLLALIVIVLAIGIASSAISIGTTPIAATQPTIRMPDGLGERVAMFMEQLAADARLDD